MTHDGPKTSGCGRLAFAEDTDVSEFVATLERFERGELSADAWRGYRLLRGIYEQRQDGANILRVKIPQGILESAQLRVLAEVARRHARGFGHITTRQNIQFHFVPSGDLETALHQLAEAGLTTRAACGNSVRNITACSDAGVAVDEVFDVTPYAEALTRHLLHQPLSSALPRKFKIAFEGCATDHAELAIQDLGWQARVRRDNGRSERGFRMTVGGGTSTLCRAGRPLYEFLPAREILVASEAILRVYQRLGDFNHRNRNRLKHLVEAMGFERWQQEVEAELGRLRTAGGARLPFDPERPPVEEAPSWSRRPPPTLEHIDSLLRSEELRGPGVTPTGTYRTPGAQNLALWSRTNVRSQKQEGFRIVTITVPLGDLTAGPMEILGELAEAYGDGTVRLTSEQNVVLRWVRDTDLAGLHKRLKMAGLGLAYASTLADVVSCPGAESCRLSVTQSRGLGQLLGEFLRERTDLVEAAGDASIRISGCPHGCSRHHIAPIGFQGSVRKLGGRAVPQYLVFLGGSVLDGSADFGGVVAKVPARRMLEVAERLVRLYQQEAKPGETASGFFKSVSHDRVHNLLADLESLTLEDVQPSDFIDLGDFLAAKDSKNLEACRYRHKKVRCQNELPMILDKGHPALG